MRFGDQLYGKYGFKDAFNLSFPGSPSHEPGWFADQYVAIDQGPILLMVENFRTERIWTLMKRNPYIRRGLVRAGFPGGWLDGKPVTSNHSSAAEPPERAIAVRPFVFSCDVTP